MGDDQVPCCLFICSTEKGKSRVYFLTQILCSQDYYSTNTHYHHCLQFPNKLQWPWPKEGDLWCDFPNDFIRLSMGNILALQMKRERMFCIWKFHYCKKLGYHNGLQTLKCHWIFHCASEKAMSVYSLVSSDGTTFYDYPLPFVRICGDFPLYRDIVP